MYPLWKQPGRTQETLTELDDRAVVDYLRHHPEFLSVTPMPWKRCVFHIRAGTVSLVEWHMARARNHINVLEENMTLMGTKPCQ
ncbi:DUF484 family protein [Salmonella enterica subsp. enterica]|nr:DUF484 family protein [Salmonella enterica subsp. enterica]